MSNLGRYLKNIPARFRVVSELGSGAGKGGGGGGPIRAAGGPFGKLEAAREKEYFHKLQQRLLMALKLKLGEENCLRDKESDKHKCAIEENDKLTNKIDRKLNDCDKISSKTVDSAGKLIDTDIK